MRKEFSEKEIIHLTIVATVINMWNRLAIATRTAPGHYRAKTAAS